jgi:threonine aldolase
LIDLRSDTVTKPVEGMRRAMSQAEVGDAVYREDPTVRALEEDVADRFGAADAVFVPSGTMANLLGMSLVTRPGTELVADADAHVVTYEGGGLARFAGVQSRTVSTPRGLLDPDLVVGALRSGHYGEVRTSAVAVEQTHNRGGGAVQPIEALRRLRELTASAGVAVHIDGARIWNAHVASGVPLADYGACADTLAVCLSKGLGAPVGSLVVIRSAEVAEPARKLARSFGGGMRQAGVLAAAGRYALAHHLDRLVEDHAAARQVAGALADRVPGALDPARVETNIVAIDVCDAAGVAARCRDAGVLIGVVGPRRVRVLIHLDVPRDALPRVIDVLAAALAADRAPAG